MKSEKKPAGSKGTAKAVKTPAAKTPKTGNKTPEKSGAAPHELKSPKVQPVAKAEQPKKLSSKPVLKKMPKQPAVAAQRVKVARPMIASEAGKKMDVAPKDGPKPNEPIEPGKRVPKTVKPGLKLQPKRPEKPLNIPPILLEGDLPRTPKAAGPGARYALTVHPPGLPPMLNVEARTELPEGYGTRRLFLTARDPRWLYASWDLMPEQQREYNLRSRDGHLILRVYAETESKPVVPDVHVNPESRSFFINVPKPETPYWAELGLYRRSGPWEQITKSQSTFTPPDAPSPEPAAVEFATIPVQVTFEQVVKTVQEFVTGHQPLLEAVIAAQEAQKREEAPKAEEGGRRVDQTHSTVASHMASPEAMAVPISVPAAEPVQFPVVEASRPAREGRKREIPIRIERAQPWTPQRKEALARLISIDGYRRVWMGSIEITELVRRQLEEEIASIAAAELARQAAESAAPGGLPDVSSPLGGQMPAREQKFWFKINAELIIYGATEPDAKVTVAERLVKLRPDGTFSFRFALPDGRYGLPAVAASADGVEAREAILEFSRTTNYRGHVEAHPQDPGLRSPRPENL